MNRFKTCFTKEIRRFLLLPWLLLLAGSFLYSFLYLILFEMFPDHRTQFLLFVILFLCANWGLYLLFCTCKPHGYRRLGLSGSLLLAAWACAMLFLFYGVATPVFLWNPVVGEVLSAILCICLFPCTLAWFQNLYAGNRTLFTLLRYLKNPRMWTDTVGLVILWMLFQAVAGFFPGFSAYTLYSALLFQGSPVMAPTVWALAGNWPAALLSLPFALFLAWLEVNVLHGTETA